MEKRYNLKDLSYFIMNKRDVISQIEKLVYEFEPRVHLEIEMKPANESDKGLSDITLILEGDKESEIDEMISRIKLIDWGLN